MMARIRGRAWAVAGISVCLTTSSPAVVSLYAQPQQEYPQSPRVIALGPSSTARVQPLTVEASRRGTTAPSEPAAVAPPGMEEEPQYLSPQLLAELGIDAALPSALPTDDAPEPEQEKTPVTGKLFGDEDPSTLFGIRGGYFHPSLLFEEEWTDNFYNLKLVEQDNYLTVISPGIWLGFPRMDTPPLNFSTNNSAVGGTRFLGSDSQSSERILAYLSANLDYKTYTIDSSLDSAAWRLEGYSHYKMPSGFTLHILDRVTSDRDRFDRGSFPLPNASFIEDTPALFRETPEAWDYTSNLVNAAVQYDMADRYSAKLDYTNFLLTYEGDANHWLNRTDNNLMLSLTYHYSPKTSLFAEYNIADVAYDDDDANNSTYTGYSGGLSWKSAKISLMARGGYQAKEYSSIAPMTTGTFSLESLFDWLITDKTKISLSIYKAMEESNIRADRGMDTLAGTLRYEQRLTYRLRGTCAFVYELNDHTDFARTDLGLLGEERQDTTFSLRPALEYSFRDWLAAGLTYSYEQRNSTDSRYDYTTQTVTLGINFTL